MTDKLTMKKPYTQEAIACRGEDLFSDYNWLTQVNPNDFFEKEKQRTLVTQKRIMFESDLKLYGLFLVRELSLIQKKRQITGGEKHITQFVKDNFARIPNFNWKLRQMQSAIPLGFSITEILWEIRNNQVWIKDLLSRCQDKFVYDKEWVLKVITLDNPEGESLHNENFLEYTYAGEYGNKYGSAVLQNVYWYWFFKKHSIKFWAIFNERFARPRVIATRPDEVQKDDENVAVLAEFIKRIELHAGIQLPAGWVVDLLEAKNTGQISNHEQFVNYLDDCMAGGVLGQSMTTHEGKVGSYAAKKVGERVQDSIIESDCDFLESVLNDQLIKRLVDYNFSNVKEYPKFEIARVKEADRLAFARAIKTLVEAGHPFIPLEWINQKMGIPEKTDKMKDEDFLKLPERPQSNFVDDNFHKLLRQEYTRNAIIFQDMKGIN